MSWGEQQGDGGLGVMARLSLSLDALTKTHEQLASRLARPRSQPVFRPVTMAGPAPSSGLLALNLGGPEMGRVWHVRSIAVGGETPTTSAAGRVDVFSGAPSPGVGPPISGDQPGKPGFYSPSGFSAGASANWRDYATTLPNTAFYGLGELIVLEGQSLWVVISSATSTQIYQASSVVQDEQVGAYETYVGV